MKILSGLLNMEGPTHFFLACKKKKAHNHGGPFTGHQKSVSVCVTWTPVDNTESASGSGDLSSVYKTELYWCASVWSICRCDMDSSG